MNLVGQILIAMKVRKADILKVEFPTSITYLRTSIHSNVISDSDIKIYVFAANQNLESSFFFCCLFCNHFKEALYAHLALSLRLTRIKTE